jgi:hypothetical protein
MLIAIALIKMFLSKFRVLARERRNATRSKDQVSYTGDYNLVFSRLKLFFLNWFYERSQVPFSNVAFLLCAFGKSIILLLLCDRQLINCYAFGSP